RQVVEPYPGVFEVERVSLGHRGQNRERNVLVESPRGPGVGPRKIEPVIGDRLLSCDTGRGSRVHRHLGLALQVPLWRHPERDRPVPIVLVDGRIAVVAQLVPVVPELLPKHIQDRPPDVAGGTRQPVLPREGRNGMTWLAANDYKRCEKKGDGKKRPDSRESTNRRPSDNLVIRELHKSSCLGALRHYYRHSC